MADRDDKELDLEGIDWDDALKEWEDHAFVPEVAKDKETQNPGGLTGTPAPPPAATPSGPVQSPPLASAPFADSKPAAAAPAPSPSRPPRPGAAAPIHPALKPPAIRKSGGIPAVQPPPPKSPEGPHRAPERTPLLGADESGATVIADIPAELLRRGSEQPAKPAGGGLSQLFGRGSDRPDVSAASDRTSAAPGRPRASSQPELGSGAAEGGSRTAPPPSDVPHRRDSTPMLDPEGASIDELLDPFTVKDPFDGALPDLADLDVFPVVEGTRAREVRLEPASPPPTSSREVDASPGPPLHQPMRRAFDPDLDTSIHVKGAILSPSSREYDPNEETSILSKAAVRVHLEEAVDDDGENPTRFRSRDGGSVQRQTQSWDDERPAPERLPDAMRASFAERAQWIEAEARLAEDRVMRARALLVASELRAILGEVEAAEILAREAAATAPTLAMAPRQARALAPVPRDAGPLAEALAAEGRQSPTVAGRVHDALLAADVLRLAGDHEGAAKRWDSAVRVAPGDPRAPLARAAARLAKNETTHASLSLPDAPELEPLAKAVAHALRIRGASRPDIAAGEPLPNDAARRAREALVSRDVGAAAHAVSEVARIAELRDAATWLAASLASVTSASRGDAVDWLRAVAKDGAARRALAARAVELRASDVLEEAARGDDALDAADRAVLAVLASVPQASSDEDLDKLAQAPGFLPLAAALAAVGAPRRRADRVAGAPRSRNVVRLARLLAAGAPAEAIEEALAPLDGDHDGETRAVALEMAARAGRYGEVSDAIAGWSDDDEEGARDRSLAAALVAERAGDPARAAAAYTSARAFDPSGEAALRALASLQPGADFGADLRSLGDARGEGACAAMAWLEAVARGVEPALDEDAQRSLLEAAHRAAPGIPIAVFLAERAARRAGEVETVLHWIRERRAATASKPDPVQIALDDVVEALLVADKEPELATERLAEAHGARPDDLALRELYERVAVELPTDIAAWRERRAASSHAPATRARFFLEAAHQYERAGDTPATLRNAAAALAEDVTGLARLALERSEIESGAAARLADSLLALARSTSDSRDRREAYERLADLDATGRDDATSALLWHKTILEDQPDYIPSLRHVEHALLTDGRVDELEPIASALAHALAGRDEALRDDALEVDPPERIDETPDAYAEASAHAELAARLKMRGATGEWEPTRPMAELGASLPAPSLWSLRALAAHARVAGDDSSLLRASLALADRTTHPEEIAALVLRAGEAAMRMGDLTRARELLERAAREDAGDVVTWGLLAEVRQRSDNPQGAAEACESLARASVVDEHRLLAWYDAGQLWLDEVGDEARGIQALEEAARVDLSHEDIFPRLSGLYSKRGARAEMANLLERRLETAGGEERVRLEVDRAAALIAVGEPAAARRALESALASEPDDPTALSSYADLCADLQDWEAAEQSWVRLVRLVSEPEEQLRIYRRLGKLYSEHAVNLARAEVAMKEVLRRAPNDVATLEGLVEIYRRTSDGPRALEVMQQLLPLATTPDARRARITEIASIHETVTRDLRKAEQALEAVRREYPSDVGALRALAEFYQRQKQGPAVNILLDRASADARRALTAGRFSPALFEVLQTVHEFRGKRDAARVAASVHAALEGRDEPLTGAGKRAGDPRLDDLLAPEAMSAGLRALLLRAGDALDVASALDLRAMQAQPLAPGMAQSRIAAIASSLGVPPVQVLVSPQLGSTCVPSASNPPCVVVGEPLLNVLAEPAAAFVITRALKLVQAHASALVRTPPADLAVLVSAWLQAFNPSWTPQGAAPAALADAKRRLAAGLPKKMDAEAGTIVLEVAGTILPHLATLGASAIGWADRVALLAVGDPAAALDGIAWSLGLPEGAPKSPERRSAWVLQTAEVRDLLGFAVGDAFAEARARAGVSG
jgi:predicted Zn-dependent protease